MTTLPLAPPRLDPTPIFELFRGNYATELLTAAVADFSLFARLSCRAVSFEVLRGELGLAERPARVLLTALAAMNLVATDERRNYRLTNLATEHLVPGAAHDVSAYIALSADAPGVRAMVERLRTNRPAGEKPDEDGVGFIYRDGLDSAMEEEQSARRFTMALAGRAKVVAPALARVAPVGNSKLLLDVGGGTGLYSIACLERHASLEAIVWDRPEVLKVAAEMAAEHGLAGRLRCLAGDMFVDDVPAGVDIILLSNVLHDWDVPECQRLVERCAAALRPGGQLWIHDVFLNDALDGPLPIALYSAALFSFTEGRAYSAAEYRSWLRAAGLVPGEILPTLVHCGLLPATRSA